MPIVMATGQAAGVCAALAAREGTRAARESRPAQRADASCVRQGASLRRDVVENADLRLCS